MFDGHLRVLSFLLFFFLSRLMIIKVIPTKTLQKDNLSSITSCAKVIQSCLKWKEIIRLRKL